MPSRTIGTPTIFVFDLDRCPHCNVSTPNLIKDWETKTNSSDGQNERIWLIYRCNKCGGLVLVSRKPNFFASFEYYPKGIELDQSIPNPARDYLKQAIESMHALLDV